MPIAVGIDLASVSAVADAIRAHGAHYLERVYTARELAECSDSTGEPDPARLAARFAAKEATLKALQHDDRGVPLTAIEVRSDELGRVELALAGAAAELAEARGAPELSVSLTHEEGIAAAVVVAECKRG